MSWKIYSVVKDFGRTTELFLMNDQGSTVLFANAREDGTIMCTTVEATEGVRLDSSGINPTFVFDNTIPDVKEMFKAVSTWYQETFDNVPGTPPHVEIAGLKAQLQASSERIAYLEEQIVTQRQFDQDVLNKTIDLLGGPR